MNTSRLKLRISLVGCLCFFIAGFVSGQERLTGKLVDTKGEPVPFANVLLLQAGDSTFLKGGLTDLDGTYLLESVKPGSYYLQYSFLGYEKFTTSPFKVVASSSSKDFGQQVLQESSEMLDEVVIKEDRPLFEQKNDRMVVNVGNNILTKGSTALQVLERSPGVMIDRLNNGLTLNGKNGVMIMMNGKLMRLPFSEVINLLNGMSADDIESIELLTTPPAKYDAEGNAGMINIVSKKREGLGTKGSFSLSTGHGFGEKALPSINVTHSTEKVNAYGSYSFSRDNHYYEWFGQGSQIAPLMGGQQWFDFWNETRLLQNTHNVTAGVDTDISPNTTIGTNVTFNNSRLTTDLDNLGEYTIGEDSLLILDISSDGTNQWDNLTTNFFIERRIKGGSLNMDFDYVYFRNQTFTDVGTDFTDDASGDVTLPTESIFFNRQRVTTTTPIHIGVFKMDFSKDLSNEVNFEAGVKGTYTKGTSQSSLEGLENGVWVRNQRTAFNLDMEERIGAAYTSFNINFNPSTQLLIGARYEYSDTDTGAEKSENEVDRGFGKLFPSVFFSRKLNDKSDLRVSYSKRIGRPNFHDLAATLIYNDPVSVHTGNPLLKPVITNTVKLEYVFNGYSFAAFFSRDDNPIARLQLTENPAGDLMLISAQNAEFQNNLTFQTNIPIKINEWWSMNHGFVGGWRDRRIEYTKQPFDHTYFAYNIYGSQTFTLPANFAVELSGWYNSTHYNGSHKLLGFGMLNLGVKKDLNNDMGSISLTVNDLLKSMSIKSFQGTLADEAFTVRSNVHWYAESAISRIVKITYTKSFGSKKVKGKSQRLGGSAYEQERSKRN
ncbi:MAG: outer membrane beta-barrel protein [Bacteroidota bacterium]